MQTGLYAPENLCGHQDFVSIYHRQVAKYRFFVVTPAFEPIPVNTKYLYIYHSYNVGPTSKTLRRRCINVIQKLCVYWDVDIKRQNQAKIITFIWTR